MIILKIKSKAYAIAFWQTRIGELLNQIYGLRIFLKFSFTQDKLLNKSGYEAYLTKQYHIVEKGMALSEPRIFFGKKKIFDLITKSEEYIKTYGDSELTASIRAALDTYLDRNMGLESHDKEMYDKILDFCSSSDSRSISGVKLVSKNDITKANNFSYEDFVTTRSSVRNFSEDSVLDADIYEAIRLASNTPSVCNRQSWKVHYYKEKSMISKLLVIQNGNGGFADSIDKLLIITTDTRKFTRLESNQVFIDGGLFAMNVLLSLHSLKLGSCCLNTCLSYVDENNVKRVGEIPHSERLIMMIGVGNLKDKYEVAYSKKYNEQELIEDHGYNI